MTKAEYTKIINEMIDKVGIDNPASIAFAIIQKAAEKKRGTDFDEADALKGMMERINDAYEEEFEILMGGEGRVYQA